MSYKSLRMLGVSAKEALTDFFGTEDSVEELTLEGVLQAIDRIQSLNSLAKCSAGVEAIYTLFPTRRDFHTAAHHAAEVGLLAIFEDPAQPVSRKQEVLIDMLRNAAVPGFHNLITKAFEALNVNPSESDAGLGTRTLPPDPEDMTPLDDVLDNPVLESAYLDLPLAAKRVVWVKRIHYLRMAFEPLISDYVKCSPFVRHVHLITPDSMMLKRWREDMHPVLSEVVCLVGLDRPLLQKFKELLIVILVEQKTSRTSKEVHTQGSGDLRTFLNVWVDLLLHYKFDKVDVRRDAGRKPLRKSSNRTKAEEFLDHVRKPEHGLGETAHVRFIMEDPSWPLLDSLLDAINQGCLSNSTIQRMKQVFDQRAKLPRAPKRYLDFSLILGHSNIQTFMAGAIMQKLKDVALLGGDEQSSDYDLLQWMCHVLNTGNLFENLLDDTTGGIPKLPKSVGRALVPFFIDMLQMIRADFGDDQGLLFPAETVIEKMELAFHSSTGRKLVSTFILNMVSMGQVRPLRTILLPLTQNTEMVRPWCQDWEFLNTLSTLTCTRMIEHMFDDAMPLFEIVAQQFMTVLAEMNQEVALKVTLSSLFVRVAHRFQDFPDICGRIWTTTKGLWQVYAEKGSQATYFVELVRPLMAKLPAQDDEVYRHLRHKM